MRSRTLLALSAILLGGCHSTPSAHSPPPGAVPFEQPVLGPCSHCNEWSCQCAARLTTFPEPTFHGYQCTTWRAIPDPCEFHQGLPPTMVPVQQPFEEAPSMNRLPPIELPTDAKKLRTPPIQPAAEDFQHTSKDTSGA